MFKKLMLSAGLIIAGGFLFSGDAQAQYGHHHHGGFYGDHGRFHDHLDHNEFHRQLYHRDAHRYPMTRWQHGRLHDTLDHDRYHDHLRHRQYHRSYRVPSYYYHSYGGPRYGRGVGIGISPYGFSLRIGR